MVSFKGVGVALVTPFREIGEEKFFNEYFKKVMSKGPFSLQG